MSASHYHTASRSHSQSRAPTCPDENELVLLADGALADKRRASIDRHLDGCAPCTLLVAELAKMAAPVRPVPARYLIIRQLGAGAMGVVWEAEDKHLGRRVALKFVRAGHGDTATTHGARRERRSRLFREARALAQLRHPNVVSVYDVGESGDELFLALELVIGTDARTWRAIEPRTTADVLGVWRQVAAGLVAVHRAGIVHRDIKPDNVLVAADGRVLLGDFGLATDHHHATHHPSPHHERLTAQRLTATGLIIGTPVYMAYEQLVGEPASQKSDQYALCASVWEALTGVRPFNGPTLGAVALAMQQPLRIPPTARVSDRHVYEALVRGLDANPARRWSNIEALLAAIEGRKETALRQDDPRRPRRSTTSRALWLALGAAAVAAAATAGVLALRDGTAPSSSGASSLRDATPTERVPTSEPSVPRQTADERAPTSEPSVPRQTADERAPTSEPSVPPPVRRTADERMPTPEPSVPPPVRQTPDARASDERDDRARDVRTARAAHATAGTPKSAASQAAITQAEWKHALDRASSKLAFGDARACLTMLARLPQAPAVLAEQAEGLRASCTMKAGDCAGGRALYEAMARANHWDPALLAESLRAADFAYCPLDAGPRTEWAARARHRLRIATAARTSCKPVLAFMAEHRVQLTDVQEQRMLEATCRFNDGDCAGARVTWRQAFAHHERDATRIAQREQLADAAFVEAFPSCR